MSVSAMKQQIFRTHGKLETAVVKRGGRWHPLLQSSVVEPLRAPESNFILF
jgi:hypothetical protein